MKETKQMVYNPESLADLRKIITATNEKLTYVAGATDLMVQESRWREARNLVNLNGVKEIRTTFEIGENGILIGAAMPMSEILAKSVIREKYPILVEACRQIGSVQIQNRATLGGNIANASPAGDSLPVLSVLNAEILIGTGDEGKFHKKNVEEVMLGPGQNSLTGNKYIAYFFLPFPEIANQFWAFRKVGQRYALAISKLSLAVLGTRDGDRIVDIRICAGSVSAQIKRAVRTEKILRGHKLSETVIEVARQTIMKEVSPITDIRSTSGYRRKICGELLREELYNLL
ncbi:MAG: xanthine dehydrogenase family protein subunit M [Calditrichaceae bacterium]